MQVSIGDHDAVIAFEPAACPEIERPSIEVGDASSGFLDRQRARGVIPDVLAVVCTGRDAHEEIGVPCGDGHVFGLAVHQGRWTLDAGGLYHLARRFKIDVRLGKRSNHARVAQRPDVRDVDRVEFPAVHRAYPCCSSETREQEKSGRAIVIAFAQPRAVEGWTPEHGDGWPIVLEERECYDVVPGAQKTFGAIDGVERPEAAARGPGSSIHEAHQLSVGQGREQGPDELKRLFGYLPSRLATERRRILLGNERVAGEGALERAGHDRLSG